MVKKFKTAIGDPRILGTRETARGLNFAVRIPDGRPASLVLLSGDGREEIQEIDLPAQNRCGEVAAVVLVGRPVTPIGYYYKIDGEITKDPCARRIVGNVCFTDPERYAWGDDKHPGIPFSDMIIYKLHVRGFTMDPKSGVRSKGTFRGLVQKIPYLTGLGINAVLLMPAYEWDDRLSDPSGRGSGTQAVSGKEHFSWKFVKEAASLSTTVPGGDAKAEEKSAGEDAKAEEKSAVGAAQKIARPTKNYWGYAERNSYYAPKQLFSSRDDSVSEFKDMVKALHRAGIEVIMEMYFPKDEDMLSAVSALHFWKTVYHVDGFQVIGNGVPKEALAKDPLLADTKLFFDWIDAGRVYGGKAPAKRHIAICNGYYQSEARRFLKGDAGVANSFRYTQKNNPSTHAVVNYAANVNGFTLADAVSYNSRHNEANGEEGRDGTSDNNSWNCGVEGRTRKKPVMDLRRKQIRNALSYVFLSQGIPLIYAGDEFCNSQGGNNNAYACDDPVGWVSWGSAKRNKDITDFVKYLISFRREHRILHCETELRGSDYRGIGMPDVSYHDTKAWYADPSAESRSYAIMYNGAYAAKECGAADDIIYVCYNAHWECHTFALPNLPHDLYWSVVFSTDEEGWEEARCGFGSWAKENALRDIQVRLERTIEGLKAHEELVKAVKEQETDEEKPSGRKVPDFDALRLKYMKDAENETARIEAYFETAGFPENQKYIAVPPRSVTVLIGGKSNSGEV